MADEDSNVRKSDRSTKGVLPARFGDYVVDMPNVRVEKPESSRTPGVGNNFGSANEGQPGLPNFSTPRSVGRGRQSLSANMGDTVNPGQQISFSALNSSTRRSTKGSRASVRSTKTNKTSKSVELEMDEVTLVAREKVNELQDEVDALECEEKKEKLNLDILMEELEEMSKDSTQHSAQELTDMRKKVAFGKKKYELGNLERQSRLEVLRRRQDLIQDKMMHEVKKLQADLEEEAELSDEENLDSTPETKEWVESTAKNNWQQQQDDIKHEQRSAPADKKVWESSVRPEGVLKKFGFAVTPTKDTSQLVQSQVTGANGPPNSDVAVKENKQPDAKASYAEYLQSTFQQYRPLTQPPAYTGGPYFGFQEPKYDDFARDVLNLNFKPPLQTSAKNPPQKEAGTGTTGKHPPKWSFGFPSKEKKSEDSSQMDKLLTGLNQLVTTMHQKSSSESGETAKFVARTATAKDLPICSGRPEEWIQFKADYDTTTVDCKFTPVENLSRLQKCL